MGKNIKKSTNDCQGHYIPIILNGKTEGNNTGVTVNEVIYKNGKNKIQNYKKQKVILIGDSFLRGIRDNVELLTSDKFSVYSLLKPGCDLDTILKSAYKASESLTHKDLICICGGANDFNSDMEGPNVNNILSLYSQTSIQMLFSLMCRSGMTYLIIHK